MNQRNIAEVAAGLDAELLKALDKQGFVERCLTMFRENLEELVATV